MCGPQGGFAVPGRQEVSLWPGRSPAAHREGQRSDTRAQPLLSDSRLAALHTPTMPPPPVTRALRHTHEAHSECTRVLPPSPTHLVFCTEVCRQRTESLQGRGVGWRGRQVLFQEGRTHQCALSSCWSGGCWGWRVGRKARSEDWTSGWPWGGWSWGRAMRGQTRGRNRPDLVADGEEAGGREVWAESQAASKDSTSQHCGSFLPGRLSAGHTPGQVFPVTSVESSRQGVGGAQGGPWLARAALPFPRR